MDQELPSNKQNDLMSLNNSNINFFFFFKYPKELDTSDCTKKIRVTLNAVVMNLADFKITHLKIVSSRCMVVLCILCILSWMSVEKPNELYSWNHMHVPVIEREREREREREGENWFHLDMVKWTYYHNLTRSQRKIPDMIQRNFYWE